MLPLLPSASKLRRDRAAASKRRLHESSNQCDGLRLIQGQLCMLTGTVDNLQMMLLGSLPHLLHNMQTSNVSFEPSAFPEYRERNTVSEANEQCNEPFALVPAEPSNLQAATASADLVTLDVMEAAFRNGMSSVVASTAEYMGILEDRVKELETFVQNTKNSSEGQKHRTMLTGIANLVEGVLPVASPVVAPSAKSPKPKMSKEDRSKETSAKNEGVFALGEMPKGQGRPRCLTCGKSFLCMQTRAAHEFLSHDYAGSRPELGDEVLTKAWALEQIKESEEKAKVLR